MAMPTQWEAVGGRDGTVRESVGEFLQAVHSNFSSIFMRFRDIAAFIPQNATFSLANIQSPQNLPMFPWDQVDRLFATNRKSVGLIICAVTFQDFQPM